MRGHFADLIDVLQFWPKRQQLVLSDIHSLVEDGVPVMQAISTIESIYDGVIKNVAQDMSLALSQGQSLASGMEKWYPLAIVEMIRSGEEGGTFLNSLQSAVHYYEDRVLALKLVVQSFSYPFIVIVVALVMLVVIKNSVFTSFAAIKPVSMWPSIGQDIYGLATIIQSWWWLALIFMMGIGVSIYYVLQNVTGDVRYMIDRLPVLGLYRELMAARFMETLGLLITHGVVLKEALQIMARHAQPYLAWHLILMEFNLGSGMENIADVLDTALIKKDDMLRLRVMAKGTGFDHALVSLGRQALKRYADTVSRMVKIAGGFFLMIGALLAAMIVLGIYSVGSVIAN